MGKTSITTITKGQEKQIKRFAEDAVDHAIAEGFLDKDKIQKLIESGNEFQLRIVTAIQDLSVCNQFADEEVRSNYGYLSGYKSRGIVEQINRLQELFPGLGDINRDYLAQIENGEVKLPKHTEGWFAIPNWMKNPKIFGATYSGALQKILDTIKETRNGRFYNYREGQIDEKHLRQSAHTQQFFQKLSESQGNPDILIVPAQFGIRHRGRSVRRAREVFLTNEFGLGAFAVGIMILTHPERLQHYDDLWIDCAGDEWSYEADGVFGCAPLFYFNDGRVKFSAGKDGLASGRYGSASGFLPSLPQ